MVLPLEAVRDVTGESEIADAVAALTDDRVDELADRLLSNPPAVSMSPSPHEIWPLLNARMSTFATGGGSTWFTATARPAGINLMAAMDPRDSGSGRFPNGVLRALLYCHGLVLEDPLCLASDLLSGTSSELRAMSRHSVRAAAMSLAEIAPLLDSGVVKTFFVSPAERSRPSPSDLAVSAHTLPIDEIWDAFESSFVDGLGPELQRLWRAIRAGDRSPPMELLEDALATTNVEVIETFVNVLSELRPTSVVENALGIVSESLNDLSIQGAAFDLMCPTPLFARLALTGDPIQDMRIFELVRAEVPGIDRLLVEDAVSIRNNSEAFAVWRSRLSDGLERARSARVEFGTTVDVVPLVAEVLADARAGLFREVEKSGTLRARTRSALAFSAGALSGGVGNSTGGLAAAMVGATGGVIGVVLDALISAGDPLPGYLRRHYVVFDR